MFPRHCFMCGVPMAIELWCALGGGEIHGSISPGPGAPPPIQNQMLDDMNKNPATGMEKNVSTVHTPHRIVLNGQLVSMLVSMILSSESDYHVVP